MPAAKAISEPLEDALEDAFARLSSIPALVAQPVEESLARHAHLAERYSQRLFVIGACTVIGFARAEAWISPLETVAWVCACGVGMWLLYAQQHERIRARRLEQKLARARSGEPVAASFELVEIDLLEGGRACRERYVALAPSAGGPVELVHPVGMPAPPPLLARHLAAKPKGKAKKRGKSAAARGAA